MAHDKEQLLGDLKAKIADVREKIETEKKRVREFGLKPMSEIKKMETFDMYLHLNLRHSSEERLVELAHLHGSPFFVRCDVLFDRTGKKKTLFFAKHTLIEEGLYSWVSPIASIRFEQPGPVSYTLPNGKIEKATLLRKEQYMIVDGKPVFFAIEEIDSPRELVYQEHFSGRKAGFMLPEIVSVMEKAQDQIIRAHHKGPFAISGPAGSGKTTLALHRVAYLAQSPDSGHFYPESSIIVFVQDNGTKDYFSHLLPELGIHHVRITTFFEWADEVLDFKGRGFDPYAGGIEEFEKLRALRTGKAKIPENGPLSRVDVTALLYAFYKKNKKVEIDRDRTVYKNGKYRRMKRSDPVRYSLMVVDEFQNYLPEQLKIMLSCLDPETRSAVFVGDMAQQVYPGTIRSWDEIGESLSPERQVKLQKVYRNTRQILEYIGSQGYQVEIPRGIKEGPAVVEKKLSHDEKRSYLWELVGKNADRSIGLIFADPKEVGVYRELFKDNPSVRVSTMVEAQGVEFDLTCVVGRPEAPTDESMPAEFRSEQEKICRDLYYVALTRAMSEMHVIM
jgi:DNA helicase IV